LTEGGERVGVRRDARRSVNEDEGTEMRRVESDSNERGRVKSNY
jgi:hypothetical protein